MGYALRGGSTGLRRTLREVLRCPSAVVGLVVICVLVFGSISAMITYPYVEIGELWTKSELTSRYTNRPRLTSSCFCL